MARLSAQTASVLAALVSEPSRWRHGYDLARETGLKSGTLYPILIRLAERGLVEADWEAEQPAGRPRRHLYRLTGVGVTTARSTVDETVVRAASKPGRPASTSAWAASNPDRTTPNPDRATSDPGAGAPKAAPGSPKPARGRPPRATSKTTGRIAAEGAS